jgi:hypothetical protein
MDLREEIGIALAPGVGTVLIARTLQDRAPVVGSEQRDFFSVETVASSQGFLTLAEVHRYLTGWGEGQFRQLAHGGETHDVDRIGLRVAPGAISWRPDWQAKVEAMLSAARAPATAQTDPSAPRTWQQGDFPFSEDMGEPKEETTSSEPATSPGV